MPNCILNIFCSLGPSSGQVFFLLELGPFSGTRFDPPPHTFPAWRKIMAKMRQHIFCYLSAKNVYKNKNYNDGSLSKCVLIAIPIISLIAFLLVFPPLKCKESDTPVYFECIIIAGRGEDVLTRVPHHPFHILQNTR